MSEKPVVGHYASHPMSGLKVPDETMVFNKPHERTNSEDKALHNALELSARVVECPGCARLSRELEETKAEAKTMHGYFTAGVDAYAERCREADALRAQLNALRVALKPFAAFEFGKNWAGWLDYITEGDCCVLCGYDADGKETGVNVMQSDFDRARAALHPPIAPESSGVE